MIEISDETLAKNSHIPDSEIEQDIADTRREIDDLLIAANAHKRLAEVGSDCERKMANFRHESDLIGIRERQKFIEKLQALLERRNNESRHR